ncbi:GNAT family N-acetyltransferase [Planosporangium thailandense]|uniref:GNAT family N-acetyltransferase n=1 Tax=Planosporangium thailandense TaxID=765197 RepID=A0ABX0XVA7_9ACTN|nr:GNAT family protein [Planosporangium thailandense]NJC69143.1 GNAT family N-acetyltransferase [Planosporangium thailandense]
MISIRPAAVADAARLTEAYRSNRQFLAPWVPTRDEAFFTVEGQRERLERAERDRRDGTGYSCVIEYEGQLAGTITLSAIERGVAQTAHLGYWVAEEVNGRGVATQAVSRILDVAFGELGLHRVQAATLVRNTGSQRVLERNGFEVIGLARSYLKIAGEWQDHRLFQRIGAP